MADSLTTIQSVVTQIISTGTSVVTFMTSNVILLIPFGFALLGGGVALVQRFRH